MTDQLYLQVITFTLNNYNAALIKRKHMAQEKISAGTPYAPTPEYESPAQNHRPPALGSQDSSPAMQPLCLQQLSSTQDLIKKY